MPETLSFISCQDSRSEDVDKFPECAECMNREFDPFQCESCEDACNFEPYEDEYEPDDSTQEMTISEFKEFWRGGQ